MERAGAFEHPQSPRTKRNAMLAQSFHTLRGNSPHRASGIDLIPTRPENLVSARGRQDREFERQHRDGLAACVQCGQECWGVIVGQGGMAISCRAWAVPFSVVE